MHHASWRRVYTLFGTHVYTHVYAHVYTHVHTQDSDAPREVEACTASSVVCQHHSWVEFKSGACTASCGGGVRLREMRCMAGDAVGDAELCGTRPAASVECNAVPCDQVPPGSKLIYTHVYTDVDTQFH